MSCCGQKRRAMADGGRVATSDAPPGRSSPQSPRPEAPPGRLVQPRPSAAMLAYLSRNARSRRR